MAAPLGNHFWNLRSSHGRKPTFKNSDQLWDACVQYFEYAADTPLQEEKAFMTKHGVEVAQVSHPRAMTLKALFLFIDISERSWGRYCKKKGFRRITARVTDVIYTQKFEGAAVQLFNPSIIARDLGLKDSTEHSSDPNAPLFPTKIETVIVKP